MWQLTEELQSSAQTLWAIGARSQLQRGKTFDPRLIRFGPWAVFLKNRSEVVIDGSVLGQKSIRMLHQAEYKGIETVLYQQLVVAAHTCENDGRGRTNDNGIQHYKGYDGVQGLSKAVASMPSWVIKGLR